MSGAQRRQAERRLRMSPPQPYARVQPTTVARYQSAFTPRGAEDDPTDAEIVLELLLRHRDKLTRLQPERPMMRTLRRSSRLDSTSSTIERTA